MEITGKVHAIMPLIEGETANGPWVRREVVVKNDNGKTLAVTFSGDKVAPIGSLKVGDMVNAEFYPESHEYGERWFTTLRGTKLQRLLVQ